jgi:hypothetical protein
VPTFDDVFKAQARELKMKNKKKANSWEGLNWPRA